MTFTNVFGGTTIYPSDVSYRAITLSANTTLDWPLETAPNGNIVAQIMDVAATVGSLVIRMPPGNDTGAGQTALFINVGANTFVVADNSGNTIVSVAPGLAWQIYLTDSSTVNGTWRSFQYGAGTSSATAGSLIGAGIKAIGATLNQSMPVSSISSNYTISSTDRASAINWTGGAGTLSLASAATVGSDWFVNVRNSGTGGVTIQTVVGGQNVNGVPSVFLNPADSAIIFSDGSNFFTVGLGQNVEFAFDYISINLTSDSSPYFLSGAELNRVSYNFFGTLTGNMQVVVPATVQQYWISNGTDAASAAYTITVKTSAGSGVAIARNERSILYCNGVDVVEADTGSISLPLGVAQGGTGAISASAARTNLGATSLGSALFTSASATVARSDLGSTAVGDALFIAVDASAGRSILGLGSIAVINSPVPAVNGGTGQTSYAVGDLLFASTTTALSKLAGVATGNALISGGVGAAPAYGKIGLTTHVSGTLPVANGGTGVTASTGTVAVVLSNSPTLVTPNLGTPSAVTLTNATGLPISTGVSGLGTSVATALGIAIGSSGSLVTNGGALGTPSSGTLTNATGLPLSTGVTGTLPVANGGTGQTTYTDGQLLIGNTTGNTLTKATLTAGTNISITNGSGAITINATDQFVGTVTSVGFTGGIVSVATATTTPALTVAGTSGGIPYFSSASTWASSAALAANAIVVGGGAGAAPATVTTGTGVITALGVAVGSAGAVVTFNGALGTPSSGTLTNATGLPLSTGVSGTLPVANGGTGVTTSTGTGSVVLSASPSFTGITNFGSEIMTGTGVSTGDAVIEVGGNRSGDGVAYVDLYAQAGSAFGARFVRTAGANGNLQIINAGTGVFTFATNSTEAMRITSGGIVAVGTNSPSAAARLDVSSTTGGFLPPRMTTAQRDAISSPPNGLMLYNSTTDKLQVRAAGAWVDLH